VQVSKDNAHVRASVRAHAHLRARVYLRGVHAWSWASETVAKLSLQVHALGGQASEVVYPVALSSSSQMDIILPYLLNNHDGEVFHGVSW